MHHVPGHLHNLVCRWRHDVSRDTRWKTAGERRDKPLRDVLAELERPRLIRNLPVGCIDDEAGTRLDAETGRVLLDVLRCKGTLPVSLHVGASIRGSWRIEGLGLRQRTLVELHRIERATSRGSRRGALGRYPTRRDGKHQHRRSAGTEQ